MKKIDKRFVTVIDIGSNSIKMSMARLNHRTKIILEDKLPLRLLEKNETKISPKNIATLNRCMKRFMSRTKKYEPVYRVIATSAMRRAKNKKQVIAGLRKKWGVRVQVISGLTEAKYVLHAVESKFDLRRGKFCIADIGGGSMELIQLDGGKVKWMTSIPFGSVVVKEKFCHDPLRDILDIGMVIGNVEKSILKVLPKPMEGILLLSGGTPSTLARIFQKDKKWKDIHGKVILARELVTLFDPILHKPIAYWTKKYKINPHRRDILFACLATVISLMRIIHQDYFQLSKTGLRQGILAETFAKFS
jgi:exopolyphosphatase/guanosine-5'-triphosphate,3'-diphosphate pyrophosphatase